LVTIRNHNIVLVAEFTIKLHPKTLYELGKICPENQFQFQELYLKKVKSTNVAYICLFFFPTTHYCFLGKWQMQFLFWLTLGGGFIWWLLDFYRLPILIKQINFEIEQKILREIKSVNVFETSKILHIRPRLSTQLT